MPTYDYECTSCGYIFEVFQGIKEPLLTQCPKCKKAVKRQIGAGAGFIFKGTGFYCTDFKDKKGTPDAKPTGVSPTKTASEKKETTETKTTTETKVTAETKIAAKTNTSTSKE